MPSPIGVEHRRGVEFNSPSLETILFPDPILMTFNSNLVHITNVSFEIALCKSVVCGIVIELCHLHPYLILEHFFNYMKSLKK